MINYEEIRKMPLDRLLLYHQTLKAICDDYSEKMRPLYNANLTADKIEWKKLNTEYQHAKMYYDTVFSAMQYRAYHGLENYKYPEKPEKPKAKMEKKKPMEPRKPGRPKTKKTEKE